MYTLSCQYIPFDHRNCVFWFETEQLISSLEFKEIVRQNFIAAKFYIHIPLKSLETKWIHLHSTLK